MSRQLYVSDARDILTVGHTRKFRSAEALSLFLKTNIAFINPMCVCFRKVCEPNDAAEILYFDQILTPIIIAQERSIPP